MGIVFSVRRGLAKNSTGHAVIRSVVMCSNTPVPVHLCDVFAVRVPAVPPHLCWIWNIREPPRRSQTHRSSRCHRIRQGRLALGASKLGIREPHPKCSRLLHAPARRRCQQVRCFSTAGYSIKLRVDNVNVHRAAAKDIVSKSHAARGSVCNVLLSRATYHTLKCPYRVSAKTQQ